VICYLVELSNDIPHSESREFWGFLCSYFLGSPSTCLQIEL